MRTTTLDDILFPVEARPLYFRAGNGDEREAGTHQVVVNLTCETPVGVVGRNYHLVSNQQAVNYARQCAAQLFGTDKAENLEVFNVYAPPRGWCCHVDLIHKGYEVNLFKQEVYLPFVRVTNSYNATRALRFDIGYCRKLCLNGMVFEAEAIRFNFSHSRNAVGRGLDFAVGKGKLDALRQRLASDVQKLHDYPVAPGWERPLFFKALDLPLPPPDEEKRPERRELFESLKCEVARQTEDYFEKLGRNGYALLNAMTDFASHPPEVKHFHCCPTGLVSWE